MIYLAHTAEDGRGERLPEAEWQPLKDHLLRVAAAAGTFAEHFEMREAGVSAGMLHDLGKYRREFQDYLRGLRQAGKDSQHAVFGAAWALANDLPIQAFAVQGHHAGMKDCEKLKDACLDKSLRPHELAGELERVAGTEGIHFNGEQAFPLFLESETEIEFATRMIFSALVDADRLDTACWPESPPPEIPLDAGALLEACLRSRSARAAETTAGNALARLRNDIFDSCLRAAEKPQGFFSLTVPTGGGKTLAALAFALAHARRHGLRRVIVVIPYLSIIEQNAADYRRVLGDDVVLECHSAVEPKPDASEQEKAALELVTENWDAPVVVTTSVQFIESLFAASPSRCRKLHRIARSVVIFDEVQTLPSHLLSPTLSVLRELRRHYGVSIVFSSATQPAFRKASKLPDGFTTGEVAEITDASDGASTVAATYRALRRVDFHLPKEGETIEWPALAERLAALPQVLCVVNLTRHARELWEALRALLPADALPIHLSSHMCPQHRLDLIHFIKAALRAGEPVRVISTQLIEAGVDVDFPAVYRAMGPLDAIVQAAGRCNREGRTERGQFHVFQPADGKLPRGVYSAATQCAAKVLAIRKARGEEPAQALAEDAEIFAEYFSQLWLDIPTDHAAKGERTIQQCRENCDFATVAERAKVIPDEGQTPVIVTATRDGREFASHAFVKALRDPERKFEPGKRFTKDDLRRLQRFMVNVRNHAFQRLAATGGVEPLLHGIDLQVLNPAWYHAHLGLLVEGQPPQDLIA